MPNYIKRIGLELEGGWSYRPVPELRRDGSVEGVRGEYVGEISSPPYALASNAEAWMRKYYPTSTNETCGFHIHVSLEPGHYMRLMSAEFFAAYQLAYHQWGSNTWPSKNTDRWKEFFYERLQGRNRFCLPNFNPDTQTKVTSRRDPDTWNTRYAQLNFCHALHGTLESRLLPMFEDPSLSASGMHVFLNLINAWLEQELSKPNQEIVTDLIDDEAGEQIVLPEPSVLELERAEIQTDDDSDYLTWARKIYPSVFRERGEQQAQSQEVF